MGQAQRPGPFTYVPGIINLRKEFGFLFYRNDLHPIDLAQGESELSIWHTLNSVSLYCYYGTRKFLLVINSASFSSTQEPVVCSDLHSRPMGAAALAKFLCFRKCWHMPSVVRRLWLVFLGSSSPKPTDDQSWILSMWEWNVRLVTMGQSLSCCWGIFGECSEYVSLWYCEICIWSSLDSWPPTLKPQEGPKEKCFFVVLFSLMLYQLLHLAALR